MANLKKSPSKSRPWVTPKEVQAGRTVDNYKLYNSKAWRRLSKHYRQLHPLCEVDSYIDNVSESQVVDHIIPVAQGGAAWDRLNLMAMSHKWHNVKSGKETHKKILVEYILLPSGEKVPKRRKDIQIVLTGGRV